MASRDDHARFVRGLVDAFWEDPLYGWIVGPAARRQEALLQYFGAKLRAARERGTLRACEDGALLVYEDHAAAPTPSAGLAAIGDLVPEPHLRRIREVFDAIDAIHPAQAHVYLDVIATDPARRGRGVGGRLLSQWLDENDQSTGLPVHLQSSNPANLSFYRRHGFRQASPVELPHGAGVLVPFTRDPTWSGG